jgi:hypothetical protein
MKETKLKLPIYLSWSALLLMRARPFQLKGLFQKFAHRGRALSHEGTPSLIKRALSGIDQAKIRHSFALEMNVGAGTQFVHR